MSSDTKLSFSFSGTAPKALAPAPAPAAGKSNMELLMAKAAASSSSSKPGPVNGVSRSAPISAPNSAPGSRPRTARPPAALFGGDEDEDDAPPPPSLAGPSRGASALNSGAPPKPILGRAARKAQEEALRHDQSVFDYDGVYDTLKAAERKREEQKKAEGAERKPKYIENFLASAQTRRLDKLRAEEKMLALEREKEGDAFQEQDKTQFVTEAYKKQMEEVRKAEEEEKAREEALRKSGKGPGLSAFYKQMLDSSTADRAAAIEASAVAGAGAGPSLAIRPPTQEEYEPEPEYDPSLRASASSRLAAGSSGVDEASGKEVEVNDDGEIVDKRSLLKAGLNITKKPKPTLPNSLIGGTRSTETLQGPYQSRAVGSAAGYHERIERERQRLAAQIKEEAERKKAEHEQRMKEEEEAARKRREGDDGEAEKRRKEARERFLARKRAREEGGEGEEASKKAKE